MHSMTLRDLPSSSSSGDTGRQVLRILCAVLFPPLGVFLRVRFTLHFWVNIGLTLLGYIPGLVHAIWVLARRTEDLYPHHPDYR